MARKRGTAPQKKSFVIAFENVGDTVLKQQVIIHFHSPKELTKKKCKTNK